MNRSESECAVGMRCRRSRWLPGQSGLNRNFFVALLILTGVALMFVACGGNGGSDKPSLQQALVDSVISPDGVMIYFDVTGSGDKSLVLVHAWNCDRSYWNDQRSMLARDYRVITLDLAGHGQSGTNRADYTVPAFGGDVASVVEKLDLRNVILVGHSMGGAVIIEAARQLPGRVVALVGVDTYQDLAQQSTEEQIQRYMIAMQSDYVATTELFVRSLFPASADSALVNRVSRDMASAPEKVALSALANVMRYNSVPALKEIQLPVRAINADMFPTNVDGNRAVTASFEVRYLPGRGHFLHLEDPTGFNALLRETLREFWPEKAA